MPSLFAVLMMRTPVHVAAAVSAVPRNVELVLYVIHFRQSRPYAQISPRLAMRIFLTFSMFMLLVRSSHRHHFFFSFSSFVQQMYLVVTLNKSPLLCQPNAVGPRPG